MHKTKSQCDEQPVYIHGVGAVGPFGAGLQALATGLVRSPPVPQPAQMRGAGANLQQMVLPAGLSALEDYVPKRSLRRLDRFARLALLGGHLCLQDAGATPGDLQQAGLLLATGYGATATTFAFLDSCLEDGDALASPTHFSNSVHNAAAAHLAMQMSIQGPCCTVSRFKHSFAQALGTAQAWIKEGRVGAVLLGAVDELCDVLAYCHARFCGTKARPPLPGEGAAFFLLRPEPPRDTVVRGIASLPSKECDHGEHFSIVEASTAWDQEHKAQPRQASHGRLYGVMPAGQGLDAAVAALCLQEGRFYAPVGSNREAEKLPDHAAIVCLQSAGQDQGAVLLRRYA